MEDATLKITTWKDDYNPFRPHNTLRDISPEENSLTRSPFQQDALLLAIPNSWGKVSQKR